MLDCVIRNDVNLDSIAGVGDGLTFTTLTSESDDEPTNFTAKPQSASGAR